MKMYSGLRMLFSWNEIVEISLIEFIVLIQMQKQSVKLSSLHQEVSLQFVKLTLVKRVFYPKHNPSRPNYDAFRTAEGGYGGLLSVVFHDDAYAVIFYDAIETAKGPSLGTNFTLTSPYTILAHYQEMEWAAQFGVERGLVRISVGLEEVERLVEIFQNALVAIEKSVNGS
jgi:cystathionine beta-lyase/cystathionine gamma-synthase